MKIKSLKIKNFHQFSDFEIEYNDKVTKLIGTNGSGKTTVGNTAIWACIKGISEKNSSGQLPGERFRFIGSEGKSADLELTLWDNEKKAEITVSNHITKSTNQIKFVAPEDYPIDEDWLKNLLSVSLMSAKNFTELGGKKQALLLGIDTASFDEEISSIKSEYTLLNRDLKNLGDVEEVQEVECVSIAELVEERSNKETENIKRERIIDERDLIIRKLDDANKQFEELKKTRSEYTYKVHDINKIICRGESHSLYEITDEINKAEETNKQAQQYEDYRKWLGKVSKTSLEITSNRESLKKKEKERLKYIQSFDFGVNGLTVDEKGSLLLNERPIKSPYFSRGELELIVAKLHSCKNPDFKVRFLDDFELLDENNQSLIIDSLLDNGFQIITAEVGKAKKDDNSILLKECNINDENKS